MHVAWRGELYDAAAWPVALIEVRVLKPITAAQARWLRATPSAV